MRMKNRSIMMFNGGHQSRQPFNYPHRLVLGFPAFFRRGLPAMGCLLLCLLPLLGCPVTLAAAETGADNARKAAIFVANRADKSLDDKLGTLEDFISSHITEKGFTVISREVATDALSSLKKDSSPTAADQLLSDNSSVLRLGQMLGVDYLIVASI